MRRLLGPALGIAILLLGRAAMAQVCSASTTGLTFSAYDPFAPTPSSITGSVSVTCQALVALGLVYTIQFNGGMGGTIAARAMSSGANRLSYQLYTTAARSVVWGDGTGGTGVVTDGYLLLALGSVARSYTAYGFIPARQMAAPGVYVDVVTIQITY